MDDTRDQTGYWSYHISYLAAAISGLAGLVFDSGRECALSITFEQKKTFHSRELKLPIGWGDGCAKGGSILLPPVRSRTPVCRSGRFRRSERCESDCQTRCGRSQK